MRNEQGEYDVESLRITREEASEVLDRQIEAINEIKNKAARTLRLNVLFLGILLTVTSLLASSRATPTVGRMDNGFVVAGVVVSGVSILTAVWAYTGSTYQTGTGPSDVQTVLQRRTSEVEWLTALLYSYAVWMRRNEQISQKDRAALLASHFFFFLSVGYYASGVVYGSYVGPRPYSWATTTLLVFVCGVGISIVLLLPKLLLGNLRSNAFAR